MLKIIRNSLFVRFLCYREPPVFANSLAYFLHDATGSPSFRGQQVYARPRVPREYYLCQPSACLSAYIFDELVPSQESRIRTPRRKHRSRRGSSEITFRHCYLCGICTSFLLPAYLPALLDRLPARLPTCLYLHFVSVVSTFVS